MINALAGFSAIEKRIDGTLSKMPIVMLIIRDRPYHLHGRGGEPLFFKDTPRGDIGEFRRHAVRLILHAPPVIFGVIYVSFFCPPMDPRNALTKLFIAIVHGHKLSVKPAVNTRMSVKGPNLTPRADVIIFSYLFIPGGQCSNFLLDGFYCLGGSLIQGIQVPLSGLGLICQIMDNGGFV